MALIEVSKSRINGSERSVGIIIENFEMEGSDSTCPNLDGNWVIFSLIVLKSLEIILHYQIPMQVRIDLSLGDFYAEI